MELTAIAAIALMVSGATADLYTTKRGIVDNPGKFHEGNPAMRFVFSFSGLWGVIAVKLAYVAALTWALLRWPHWTLDVVAGVCGVLWLFAGWRNKALIRKAR